MANTERYRELRDDVEKVLNRIVSDPAYRQRMLEDPSGALAAVLASEGQGAAEVAGYAGACPKATCGASCNWTCGKSSPRTCSSSCSRTCAQATRVPMAIG